jgi:hypothetical protein
LVRFSGFLVLLSRLSLLFGGFDQREDGFRRRGPGWIQGGSEELKLKPDTRCPLPDAQFKKPV